ncbi:MAG: phosphatase PAP2 family protein [Candidatus Limnocylindria bacterium]
MMPRPSVFAFAGAGVAFVVALAVLVSSGMTDAVDQPIMEAIRSPSLAGILSPLGPITDLGGTWGVTVVAALVVAVGAAVGPWRHGVIGGLTVLAASIANGAAKVAIARTRPDLLEPIIVEHGFSFPSGHSALGMVAYGVLAVLVSRSRLPFVARRGIVIGLAVLIFLIGLSRIWLGVHYPTDVLAGWTAGAVVVLLYTRLTRSVSREPAEGAVDEDPAAPRSDQPAPG